MKRSRKDTKKKKKREKKRYKTSKDSGKKEKVERRTRFRSEKGGWVRDERRWWTIHGLHPASRLGAPPPPVSSPVLLHLRARFSTSPSPSRPTFYPVLLVSARSLHHPPNPGTHLSTLGPSVRFLSRSSPPGGVSLVTSSSYGRPPYNSGLEKERACQGPVFYSSLLSIVFHSLGKASADLRTGSRFRFGGNGSLDTSALLVRSLSRLYRFADRREFEFSDSEMSRLILLWGFKRPGPLRNITSSLSLICVFFALFISMIFQVYFIILYFIIIYWPDGHSSSFYIKTYKEDGGELKSYFLINFNDIEICN